MCVFVIQCMDSLVEENGRNLQVYWGTAFRRARALQNAGSFCTYVVLLCSGCMISTIDAGLRAM